MERDLCLCIYHLEFDLFVEKLYSFLKSLRANHNCQCDFPIFHSSHDFRNAAMCPKPPGSEFYQEACASNACPECKDLKKIRLCSCGIDIPHIEWDRLEKKGYTTKNGKEKYKKDFAKAETSFDTFIQAFRDIWAKFIRHHEKAKWQTRVCDHCKLHLEINEFNTIMDFAESDFIQQKCEHQSR